MLVLFAPVYLLIKVFPFAFLFPSEMFSFFFCFFMGKTKIKKKNFIYGPSLCLEQQQDKR